MATETHGAVTASSCGTTLTAGGSADTYATSYTQIASSTGIDCEWMTVCLKGLDARENFTVDVATGAAASEVSLFKFCFFGNSTGNTSRTFSLPVSIASGTRIAAKCKSTQASDQISMHVIISDEDAYGTADAYELIGESGSQGTAVDCGGTPHTKSSWVEIDGSISHDYDYWILTLTQVDADAVADNGPFLVDVATGAAASETAIVENVIYEHDSGESNVLYTPFFERIPSGSRVSARAQALATTILDRQVMVSIIGVNMTAPSGGGGAFRRPRIEVIN